MTAHRKMSTALTGCPALGYFHRVQEETPTEFWINNPTLAEAKAAIAAGAVGATTNPTYMARLLRDEADYVDCLIDDALRETQDVDQVADIVYQRAVARLQRLFLPLFEATNGRLGHVAIQGDPRRNTDTTSILEGAARYRELGRNIIVKVPSWPAGARALEELAADGVPTIGTLGFSVDQATYMADAYARATSGSSAPPPCYVTFIAGVLDDYLAAQPTASGQPLSKELLRHAGCAATRVAYGLYQARRYAARLMGGGARGPHHFTELVGADMAVTIGWSIAREILLTDESVAVRIAAPTSSHVSEKLAAQLPDFRRAYEQSSLDPCEFQQFGPVAGFQASFLRGMVLLLDAISSRHIRATSIGSLREKA